MRQNRPSPFTTILLISCASAVMISALLILLLQSDILPVATAPLHWSITISYVIGITASIATLTSFSVQHVSCIPLGAFSVLAHLSFGVGYSLPQMVWIDYMISACLLLCIVFHIGPLRFRDASLFFLSIRLNRLGIRNIRSTNSTLSNQRHTLSV